MASDPAQQTPTKGLIDPTPAARAKYAKDVNLYINEYIRFADLKAGAALTLALGVSGAIGQVLQKIFAAANHSSASLAILTVLSIVAVIMAAASIVFCAFALIPRTTSQPSLNSYPDIAMKEPEAYAREVAVLTESQMVHELCTHNVAVSRVAVKKFDAIATAVKFLVALLLTSFAIIILFVLASLPK